LVERLRLRTHRRRGDCRRQGGRKKWGPRPLGTGHRDRRRRARRRGGRRRVAALLNRYVLRVRGDEAPEGDWPDRDDADDATVELIYEHTKDSPSDQLHDSEQLDTKTTAVFAAATVAIGLAGRLPENGRLVELCVYLAVGLWALTALATVLVVRTRSFARTLQADDLYPEYGAHEPEQFKRLLVRDAARAYNGNRAVLKRKARLFNAAVYATGLEGLFIVLALVLSR
jgi:hypothetical protein